MKQELVTWNVGCWDCCCCCCCCCCNCICDLSNCRCNWSILRLCSLIISSLNSVSMATDEAGLAGVDGAGVEGGAFGGLSGSPILHWAGDTWETGIEKKIQLLKITFHLIWLYHVIWSSIYNKFSSTWLFLRQLNSDYNLSTIEKEVSFSTLTIKICKNK